MAKSSSRRDSQSRTGAKRAASNEALDGEILEGEVHEETYQDGEIIDSDDQVVLSTGEVEVIEEGEVIVDTDEGQLREIPLPKDRVMREVPNEAYDLPAPPVDSMVVADPLTTYMAQLRYVPPLSAEEQQSLAIAYTEEDDTEAARKLIMSNLRLVVKIAREYHRRNVSLMELVQEGNVGLSEAIRRYDPYRGVKFTSYAQYWIRAMILNYLMNVMQLVKVGSTRSGRKLFYNLQKAREALIQEGFLTPSTRQLAEHIGVSEEDVIQVSQVLDQTALSLEAPAPGYESTSLASIIADEDETLPEQAAHAAQLQEQVRVALDDFRRTLGTDREIRIWDQRVVALEAASLRELGEEFSVSRERIRQIEAALKGRFRDFWLERYGAEETAILFED